MELHRARCRGIDHGDDGTIGDLRGLSPASCEGRHYGGNGDGSKPDEHEFPHAEIVLLLFYTTIVSGNVQGTRAWPWQTQNGAVAVRSDCRRRAPNFNPQLSLRRKPESVVTGMYLRITASDEMTVDGLRFHPQDTSARVTG